MEVLNGQENMRFVPALNNQEVCEILTLPAYYISILIVPRAKKGQATTKYITTDGQIFTSKGTYWYIEEIQKDIYRVAAKLDTVIYNHEGRVSTSFLLTLFCARSLADLIEQVLDFTHLEAAEGFYERIGTKKLSGPYGDAAEQTVSPIPTYGGNWR